MSRLDEVQDEEKHSEKQEERLIDAGRQQDTICQRRSYPYYIVTYNIKWVTTS